MSNLLLHHISYPVRDVDRSARFYQDIFGLSLLPRPDFEIDGVWLGCADRQIHLVANPEFGTFRLAKNVDIADVHFAFWTDDFEAMVEKLTDHGFSEALPKENSRRLLIIREGLAGFPQLYLLDPDRHTIEVNSAPM